MYHSPMSQLKLMLETFVKIMHNGPSYGSISS